MCLFSRLTSGYGTEFLIQGFQVQNPVGGSKVDSAFHLFEVDQMSTRNIWGLSNKKQTVSLKAVELIHKKEPYWITLDFWVYVNSYTLHILLYI